MKRAFYLNLPACIRKCKQTQAIAIIKLIFDTADAKKLMKGILVLRLACVRHSYMQLQFTAIYLAKVCSLKFSLIFAVLCFHGVRSRCYTCDLQHDLRKVSILTITSLYIILVPKRELS